MITYAGVADVARWCGVGSPAVSNWLTRFTNYPPPDIQIGLDTDKPYYGWLPARKEEWIAWAAAPWHRKVR